MYQPLAMVRWNGASNRAWLVDGSYFLVSWTHIVAVCRKLMIRVGRVRARSLGNLKPGDFQSDKCSQGTQRASSLLMTDV